MPEFMHHIVENREYIQRDIDLFHAYQAIGRQIVEDPWTLAEETNE